MQCGDGKGMSEWYFKSQVTSKSPKVGNGWNFHTVIWDLGSVKAKKKTCLRMLAAY